jgi:hypothetical protein
MSMVDFKGLLDDAPKHVRPVLKRKQRVGRPLGKKNKPKTVPDDPPDVLPAGASDFALFKNTESILTERGVSITFLMKVFGMGRVAVERALEEGRCAVKSLTVNGGNLYRFKDACECLLTPRRELKGFLKDMTATDLPQHLRETFWNAKRKEMLYRQEAGELWTTTNVMAVLGQAFKTIKEHSMHWADQVEEKAGLTPDQHTLLIGLVDECMDDLHKALLNSRDTGQTQAYVADLKVVDEDGI